MEVRSRVPLYDMLVAALVNLRRGDERGRTERVSDCCVVCTQLMMWFCRLEGAVICVGRRRCGRDISKLKSKW